MESRTLERELPEDAALRRPEDVPSPDEDLLAYLQAAGVNGAADTGRVCATLIADYDAVEPADVHAAFRDAVDATGDGGQEGDGSADAGGDGGGRSAGGGRGTDGDAGAGRTRIVESTRELLDAEYEGRQAFVGVELQSGHVFADRVALPEAETDYGSERYRAFVDRFGDPEGHATLTGQRVAVAYDEAAGRWHLDLEEPGDAADESPGRTVLQRAVVAGLYAVTGVVLVGGVAVLGSLAAAGGDSLALASFVTSSLTVATVALFVALALSVGRTLYRWNREETASSTR